MSGTTEFAGLVCHGLDLSYFTGKVEGFLRYREIPHRRAELTVRGFQAIARATGLAQMPAIQLPDGRWMSDSTPMIAFLDARCPAPGIIPSDPCQHFFSALLEDYADEWLWRPALYYRWRFEPDRTLMSARLAREMLTDVPLPLSWRRQLILRRQISKYLKGDGVTAHTSQHIESIYARNLSFLQKILERRDFLLGDRPSLADFGFFGPFFRHFALDPTPARLMRDSAPSVFAWVARLWNARHTRLSAAPLLPGVPEDWRPILADFGRCYLPYLNANAAAWMAGRKNFTVTIDAVQYHLPTHRYRVACLENLQIRYRALPADARWHADPILTRSEILPALLSHATLNSGFDPDHTAPFFTPTRVWRAA